MAEEPFPFNFVNSAFAVNTDLVLSVIIRTAVVVIFVMFTARSKKFSRVTNLTPMLIVKDGQYVEDGLKNARLNEDEYKSLMRLHGVRDMSEIGVSYPEMNGRVSFVKQ